MFKKLSIILILLFSTVFAEAAEFICIDQKLQIPQSIYDGNEDKKNLALDWLYSMQKDLDLSTQKAKIFFNSDYSYEYLGSIEGSVELSSDFGIELFSPSILKLVNPSSVEDSYRGIVSGELNEELPNYSDYEVRAYLFTDTEYYQPSVLHSELSETGGWSLDLSSVPVHFSGSWRFKLHNKLNDGVYTDFWPQKERYKNLEIRYYAKTDADYFVEKAYLFEDLSFSFDARRGAKKISLYDTLGTANEEDDILLSSSTRVNGLLRSYDLKPGDEGYGTSFQERSYVYDQALAVSVFARYSEQEKAENSVKALISLQKKDGIYKGGFLFSGNQAAPLDVDPIYRTGAHAFALYALLDFIEYFPESTLRTEVLDSFNSGVNYLDTVYIDDGFRKGLYLGGQARYINDIYEPDYIIPWVSTEHNTDLWHVFVKASHLIGADYKNKSNELKLSIMRVLWDEERNIFYQGYLDIADRADSLDVNSWGGIFLSGIGENTKHDSALERISIYRFVDPNIGNYGWSPYSSEGGYSGATKNVWYEGSFGVALSYLHSSKKDDFRAVLENLERGQLSNGSFPYASHPDKRYEIITASSVASTAWYLLVADRQKSFWSECDFVNISLGENKQKGSRTYYCKDDKAINYKSRGFCLYQEEDDDVPSVDTYQSFDVEDDVEQDLIIEEDRDLDLLKKESIQEKIDDNELLAETSSVLVMSEKQDLTPSFQENYSQLRDGSILVHSATKEKNKEKLSFIQGEEKEIDAISFPVNRKKSFLDRIFDFIISIF